MKQDLQRYSHILSADDHYTSWQEVVISSLNCYTSNAKKLCKIHLFSPEVYIVCLYGGLNKTSSTWQLYRFSFFLCKLNKKIIAFQVEADCKEDPEGLALRLAGKGAVSAALKVAESAGLSIDLRRELQGRQLVKLLTADPLNGGGPAEASRFLSSLRDTDDALPVAMGAMQLLPNLRSKQLLVIKHLSSLCFFPFFNDINFIKLYFSDFWNSIFISMTISLCPVEGSLLPEAERRESVWCWDFPA